MIRILLPLAIVVAIYLWWRPPTGSWSLLNRWLSPALGILLALLYLGSPIDLVPDVGVVGLLDDLLVLVGAIWWARRRAQTRTTHSQSERRSEPRNATADPAADPYSVLGVSRNATQAQITHAYREQMKLYHPDRVNSLGEELQRVAHQKTLDIQRAYDQLRAGSATRQT